MIGTVELLDRVATLPPGPDLSAALADLPWAELPNTRLVEAVQAQARQVAHEQARLLSGLVAISHTTPVDELPGPDTVARAMEASEWAAGEIAAGLTWTRTFAERELRFATVVVQRLPLVFTALEAGQIDRGKATVFADLLDPCRGELTGEQIAVLCARFVPQAPEWTTKQLRDRLYRAILAIDPGFRSRRYRAALAERGVALYLDPDTGTATLAGEGLPPGEAAAAAARLDRLAAAARRAGHPGRLGQIGADLMVGMLDGEFHRLTEAQIIAKLLATSGASATDHPADTDAAGPVSDADAAATSGTSGKPTDDGDPAEDAADDADDDVVAGTSGSTSSDAPAGEQHQPPTGERVAVREGIEIRAGLATLAGQDERPGEIPGLGPVSAEIAREVAAAQQRGARWRFAVVDTDGHLLLAGPLRHRPTDVAGPGRVRGGVVEIHLTQAELDRYTTDGLGGWNGILAEIAAAWADRHQRWRQLDTHPYARFARGPLADHIWMRDRHCIGPGCARAARRCDLDHTHEHGRGGLTVKVNLGPGCARYHHPDRDRGWHLTQPRPGHFRWVSPLGRVYRVRGEPLRHDLPDPEPRAGNDQDLGPPSHPDLSILWRPAKNPPPPSAPDPPREEEAPPF